MGNSSSTQTRVVEPCFAPAEIHDVEESQEKEKRTLRHLIRANHLNYSVLYHNRTFHNHAPHILCSAYHLGATPEHLNHVYEVEQETLEEWRDSPGEVVGGDWRDYVGDSRYQRAFLDLFEDDIVRHNYDWKAVLFEYLFDEETPLINGVIGGLGHPLIHLGYALEFGNKEIAMEALTLASVCYSPLHKYIENPPPDQPNALSHQQPDQLLQRLQKDKRLDGFFTHPGTAEIDKLFEEKEDVMLEYFKAIDFTQHPLDLLHSLVKVGVLATVAAHKPSGPPVYDFFLVHVLTTAYALRVILPMVEAKYRDSLLKQHWLLTIGVYTAQLRPELHPELVDDFKLSGRDWNFPLHRARGLGKSAEDAHFVKAVRALHEFGKLWKQDDEFFLKAAVKLAETFKDWEGFQ